MVFLLSGCYGSKFLQENEKILANQRIKSTTKTKVEGLESSFEQKKAKRLSFTVRLFKWGENKYNPEKYSKKISKAAAKYDAKIAKTNKASKIKRYTEKKLHKKRKFSDKIQFGNTFMQWGKPLSIYNQSAIEQTVENLKNKMHSEGYFNSEVTYKEKIRGKLVDITYLVKPKSPYIIDSINFLIPDKNISKIVINKSLIQTGNRYRQKDLTAERDRIRNQLANNGYYGFSRQYVTFEVDTTITGNQKTMVNVLVKNPSGLNKHKIYKLDSVIFVSDSNSKLRVKRRQKTYNNITYDYVRDIYSSKILDWRIFIYPDSLYSEKNTFETQKQLSNVNNFKFINIKYDTTGGSFIAHVFTSPLKRFETSSEVGINSRGGLPGPFVNLGLVNRNTFEGLENIDLTFNGEVIGLNRVGQDTTTFDSFEYGGNISFNFPQFLIPISKNLKSKIGKYNPRTTVSGGINFVERQDFFRNTFNAAITYNWQNNKKTVYSFTLADIRYIRSEVRPGDFRNRLTELENQGNTFARSFEPGFVSSSIFTIKKDFNEYGNNTSSSSYLRGNTELGGNVTSIFGDSILGTDISYYKYLKSSIDFRHHIPLSKRTSFAFKINAGFAFPYGNDTLSTLPYEKFFFSGGSNSIRAWQPRRLGPGSFSPLDNNNNISYQFEQPGDIIFETSFEFRAKLFGFFSWAYFVDIGNVWTWYNDNSRPGSQFEVDRFLGELAVGSGMGLRLDFSFLLVRVDLGIKVFDPAQPLGSRYVLDNFTFKGLDDNAENVRIVNTPQLNIGIGYPF